MPSRGHSIISFPKYDQNLDPPCPLVRTCSICNLRHERDILEHFSFFRTDILSKAGILMKLTKNLVTIVSSLWTRYSVRKIYMQTFALM